jgi:quinol monooxygenase YgiN
VSDPGVLLIAELHALVGREAELEELLVDLGSHARSDPGCLSYRVASAAEPGEFLIVASWQDDAALRAHYDTAAYARYRRQVGPLLARPSDVVVHRISATVHARDPNPPDPGMFG